MFVLKELENSDVRCGVADLKLARFLNDNTKQIQMSQSRYNIVG